MDAKDLTHGNIKKELIQLAIPLILGNILQQFYNTIDSFIVGRYVGHEAFAAVGVAGSIMNLFIFILNGGCNGFSVIFAELYGQKNWKLLRKESFISLLLGGGFSILLSISSIFFMNRILVAIHTPEDVLEFAVHYLWFIFLGLPVTFIYNWCSAVLRALGDTMTSLWTLMISMIMNLALDYLFVVGMHMDTEGTAAATVIAQLFSAAVCLGFMRKKYSYVFFRKKDMELDKYLLKRSADFSFVSALHQSSLYIGKLLVQGVVNTCGTEVISAYTATMRIEGFANSFSDSGGAAISVFIAQNHGIGNKKRIRKGFRVGVKMMIILAMVLSVIMILFTDKAVYLLMGNPSEKVLRHADQYMKVISVFYFLCFTGSSFAGLYRGIDMIKVPVIGTIMQITIRVVLSWFIIGSWGLEGVAAATGIGWMAIVFYECIVYRRTMRNFSDEQ